MAVPNPTTIPSEIFAGDTFKWKVSLSDFPASSGWTLKYVFTNGTDGEGPFSATADGDDHQMTVSAATTSAWTAGAYTFVAYVEAGSDRVTIDEGAITVKADRSAGAAYDGRTHARTTLDAVEAVIENRATLDQMKYSIAGRSLDRMPVDDLLKFRAEYRKEVAQELREDRIKAGLGVNSKIRVRFSR
jgi:hypothetical protein